MNHVALVLAALVLVLGTHAITSAEPPRAAPADVQKWEYRVEMVSTLTGESSDGTPESGGQLLRSLGAEGWELVATATKAGAVSTSRAFFKRPVK